MPATRKTTKKKQTTKKRPTTKAAAKKRSTTKAAPQRRAAKKRKTTKGQKRSARTDVAQEVQSEGPEAPELDLGLGGVLSGESIIPKGGAITLVQLSLEELETLRRAAAILARLEGRSVRVVR